MPWPTLRFCACFCPAPALCRAPQVSDKIDALEALCDMFDDFGSLLQRLPSSQRQAEYFIRAAKELRDGELLDLMVGGRGGRALCTNVSTVVSWCLLGAILLPLLGPTAEAGSAPAGPALCTLCTR